MTHMKKILVTLVLAAAFLLAFGVGSASANCYDCGGGAGTQSPGEYCAGKHGVNYVYYPQWSIGYAYVYRCIWGGAYYQYMFRY